MSTRYLTAVYMNEEYKVAQYGQYGGDSGEAGTEILKILKNNKIEDLKNAISKCRFTTEEDINKYNAAGTRQEELYPQMSVTVGGQILTMILSGKVNVLENKLDLVREDWYIWAYVIDFDSKKFEVYKGHNKEPLTENERFYFNGFVGENGIYPPIKVAEFSLKDLPNEEKFVAECHKMA